MYNCNISKSKLAFPLSNKIYLSVIASTALKLLRLKPEYFFLGHPVHFRANARFIQLQMHSFVICSILRSKVDLCLTTLIHQQAERDTP